MGIVTNTFTTYEAVGNREDLIDVITNISPTEAWFQSNIGSVRASARYHEWQTDVLAAAAANAVIEGDQVSATAITPTVRAGNYCQILRKTFSVTDTQEVVDKAGRDSEIAYQTAKNLKELANDIEYAMIVNSASASGNSGLARQLCGLVGWLTTNTSTGATGTTSGDMTETLLNANLQLVWAQGGKPSNVLVGAYSKRKISAFTTNTREISADAKKLTAAVDIYQSDFGTVIIRLHHIIQAALNHTAFVLGDLGLFKKAWLRPVKKEKMARVAASTLMMIEAELTLECRQEKGHGRIYNLTGA